MLPTVGIAWRPEEHTTAGLKISRGYRGGGSSYAPILGITQDYDPESAWEAELYARHEISSHLTISGSLYYTRLDDMQVPAPSTIVSGLPRSGTSLMMQMFRAAGMDLMHDGKRAADEDNLEGYWEWEEIKTLKKNPRLIEQADGKVIKVISALLPQLPPRHKYRIIFMLRPVAEVVDSQWKMLERSGQNPRAEKQHLIETQQTHQDQTLAQLRQCQDVQLIEIDYTTMVSDPATQLDDLKTFLGDSAPNPEQLPTAIKPALHRNKNKQPTLS